MREGLLGEAFTVLREHGAGRDECVVYLTGPASDPTLVDEVVHPVHLARPGFYEVDPAWLNAAWLELADRERSIRVQVHTHGGRAGHSRTDDEFPVVQTAGFLSLVLPKYATGPVGLAGAYVAELRDGGVWIERDPASVLVVA